MAVTRSVGPARVTATVDRQRKRPHQDQEVAMSITQIVPLHVELAQRQFAVVNLVTHHILTEMVME